MSSSLKLEPQRTSLRNLLLDPNNPRFFQLEDWREIPANMYHFDHIQKAAFDRLERTLIGQIEELVDSIQSNGYIPAEVIIVKPYLNEEAKYIVIEGNRRLAAIRQIVQNAIDPEDELVRSLQELDILVYYPTDDSQQDQINERILQGIRHIGGPKEWGAYQKANLIVQLYDELEQSWTDIGKRLGLNSRLVGRYYRAYKALRQMMAHQEFGQKAKPTLFSLFDEALKSSSIRDWLRWQDSVWQFTDYQHLVSFYGLLVGDPDTSQPPRITNPQQMREFSTLLTANKPVALSQVLDGNVEIDTAIRSVKPYTVKISLRDSLQAFLEALSKYPAEQIQNLSAEDLTLFSQVEERLEYLRTLFTAYKSLEASKKDK